MSDNISSFSKILALGHRAIHDLLDGDIEITEKADGSQFSVRKNEDGTISFRSKGRQIIADAPDKMFAAGVEALTALAHLLHPRWIYRGEYISKPKHNSLTYARTPKHFFILFDIDTGLQSYLSWPEVKAEGDRLGLEVVPLYYKGPGQSIAISDMEAMLANTSILGGPKVEGIVIKNYAKFGIDGKTAMAKIVSPEFKEVHSVEWRKSNPAPVDIVTKLVAGLATPARFNKAVQRLRDAGTLLGDPRDIGPLIRSVQADVDDEMRQEIVEELHKHFWPQISRGLTRGIPDWYKAKLIEELVTTPEVSTCA